MSAPDPHATASPSARTEVHGEDQTAHKAASGQSAPGHASAPRSALPEKREKGEHIGVRLQNRWNVWQRGRAEKRGHVPTVIAFTAPATARPSGSVCSLA